MPRRRFAALVAFSTAPFSFYCRVFSVNLYVRCAAGHERCHINFSFLLPVRLTKDLF